jgi:hypothetical protein
VNNVTVDVDGQVIHTNKRHAFTKNSGAVKSFELKIGDTKGEFDPFGRDHF